MRALIVDKEQESVALLWSHLTGLGDVTVVNDGEAAFEAFCSAIDTGRPFDLVCLDTNLPQVDGIDLLAGLRQYEESRGIVADAASKILITTTVCSIDNFYAASSAGCTTFLCKPLDWERLARELTRLGVLPSSTNEA
jgi:two-component system, chemotaxis family, chemotaxis protein CheY